MGIYDIIHTQQNSKKYNCKFTRKLVARKSTTYGSSGLVKLSRSGVSKTIQKKHENNQRKIDVVGSKWKRIHVLKEY